MNKTAPKPLRCFIIFAAVPNPPHANAQSKANKLKHLAKPNSFYFIRFALKQWLQKL
jgi:hypothetical protein